jgi:hypothetical protein
MGGVPGAEGRAHAAEMAHTSPQIPPSAHAHCDGRRRAPLASLQYRPARQEMHVSLLDCAASSAGGRERVAARGSSGGRRSRVTGATGAGVLTRARPAAVARGRNSALARWTIVADCTFTPNDFRVDFQPSGGAHRHGATRTRQRRRIGRAGGSRQRSVRRRRSHLSSGGRRGGRAWATTRCA